ncbi:MAG: endonuclease MutS2 [Alistipes sp.]|nr:endonuclease MutS2 [Alistipes sp.]
MNAKSLRILEFNKIIDLLVNYASSEGGKSMCAGLTPMDDPDEIETALTQTNDALSRIFAGGGVSFSGTKDLSMSVKRLEVGSTLSVTELLAIRSTLDVTARVKSYLRTEDAQTANDSLDVFFEALEPLTALNSEIKRCIISEEEISDDASNNLRNIRRQMKNANDRIHTELNSILNSQTMRGYLQDGVITTRNGRYCIPVKSEYKSQVQGMVHDQSSTGSTFFIEPMAIVRLNNEIKELQLKEKEEIEVILAKLSAEAAQYTAELLDDYRTLTRLDFIFAKGTFAKAFRCSMPVMNTDGYIRIKQGRHPLIDRNKIVPIDIHLGGEFDTLIITGPNTGGKTVTLKTVGLLTLMGQSGLHIPATEGSTLSVFREIFADIGDEQSIEQSLSTFSSHMSNIVNILNHADERTLVLFDELCAGTDPTEGAALAISIIDHLHRKGIRTLATTHYSEIKLYALSEPGVANACCEFDVETLSPTYRLLIGIPGKSNAFAISGKLGLSADIIEAASARIKADDRAFEDLIANLEESRVTIENEREELEAYKKEIKELRERLAAKNERIDERRDKILKDANEQAALILREAKEYADEAIKTFNRHGLTAREMEEQRNKIREKKEKAEAKLTLKNKKKSSQKISPSDLTIGTRVKVLSLNLEGTVSTLPNAKGDLYVQMGILRSQVNFNDLEIIDEPSDTLSDAKTGAGKIKISKTMSISQEINLIGLTVDEAMVELDKYLDDAYLSKIPQVRIVHGKGTGALRSAVHNKLKKTKYIKEFRLGVFGEGETGVTIAEFK